MKGKREKVIAKAKTIYTGTIVPKEFVTSKKTYVKGEKFTTEHLKVFNYLINRKIIEK